MFRRHATRLGRARPSKNRNIRFVPEGGPLDRGLVVGHRQSPKWPPMPEFIKIARVGGAAVIRVTAQAGNNRKSRRKAGGIAAAGRTGVWRGGIVAAARTGVWRGGWQQVGRTRVWRGRGWRQRAR